MSSLEQSSQQRSAGKSALPLDVAPELEEILELCALIQDEVPNGSKAEKLVSRIATIANEAANAIREDLDREAARSALGGEYKDGD